MCFVPPCLGTGCVLQLRALPAVCAGVSVCGCWPCLVEGRGKRPQAARAPTPEPVPGISVPTLHSPQRQVLGRPGLGGPAQGSPLTPSPTPEPSCCFGASNKPSFSYLFPLRCDCLCLEHISQPRPNVGRLGVPLVQPFTEAHLGTVREGPPQGLGGHPTPRLPISLSSSQPRGKHILRRGKVRQREGARPLPGAGQGPTRGNQGGTGDRCGVCLQELACRMGPGFGALRTAFQGQGGHWTPGWAAEFSGHVRKTSAPGACGRSTRGAPPRRPGSRAEGPTSPLASLPRSAGAREAWARPAGSQSAGSAVKHVRSQEGSPAGPVGGTAAVSDEQGSAGPMHVLLGVEGQAPSAPGKPEAQGPRNTV